MQQDKLYFITAAFLLFIIAYAIQSNIFLNGDVGYLVQVTNRLFDGGSYARDFFETNPPMILYLYAPASLLAKQFAWNVPFIMQNYFFLLASLSSVSCYFLLKKIFFPQDRVSAYIAFLTILFVTLILPMDEFGQREHLLVILILPYLLSAVLALEGKSIQPVLAFLIGLFASFGFALKPYFLVSLCLVEGYFLWRKKIWGGFFRTESITIFGVLFFYLISIFIFQPAYIKIMLPLVSHLYFIGISEPIMFAFMRFHVDFCVGGILFAIYFYYKNKKVDHYAMIMILASIGFVAAFIIPRAPWLYHVIPAFSLVCIVLAYFIGKKVHADFFAYKKAQEKISNMLFIVPCVIGIFFVPLLLCVVNIKELIQDKKSGPMIRIAQYIESLPGRHAILCFSANTTEDCFPLIYNSHSHYGGRFPFFWWVRGVLKREMLKQDNAAIQNDKAYLFQNMIEDFSRYQVDLVIVNKKDFALVEPHFNMINFFSQNEKFRTLWTQFKIIASFDYFEIYERSLN